MRMYFLHFSQIKASVDEPFWIKIIGVNICVVNRDNLSCNSSGLGH